MSPAAEASTAAWTVRNAVASVMPQSAAAESVPPGETKRSAGSAQKAARAEKAAAAAANFAKHGLFIVAFLVPK